MFFGTRAAQQVAVVSSSLITALVPAGDAATLVDVSVEDVYGAVNTLLGGFEYTSLVGEPPLLTTLTDPRKCTGAEKLRRFQAKNFEGDVQVLFGDISATSVTKLSDETLRVVTPRILLDLSRLLFAIQMVEKRVAQHLVTSHLSHP